MLEAAADALGDAVFVGGATLGLWITDPAAPEPRPNRPGHALGGRLRHRDRDCRSIARLGDDGVREATEAEMKRLPPCGICG